MQQALLQIMQNQPCALELLWPPFLGARRRREKSSLPPLSWSYYASK
jgi:hypothetical protein